MAFKKIKTHTSFKHMLLGRDYTDIRARISEAFLISAPKDYSSAEEAWHLNLQTSRTWWELEGFLI